MGKKKVLIVEDSSAVIKMLENELDVSIYQVERARAVDEAIRVVYTDGPFDCFIVDLQILAIGLTMDEMDKYQDREGYAFLKEYLWKDKTDDEIKELKSKTIICSKFISTFKKEYRNEIDGLYLVEKGMESSKIVASFVKKICL